ncbi:hypothetical protein KY345_05885 [Candidatus Woesearchaeota archaeon]|nr:hypothetical protein [Candidatus Woesearchaeota archaeon]
MKHKKIVFSAAVLLLLVVISFFVIQISNPTGAFVVDNSGGSEAFFPIVIILGIVFIGFMVIAGALFLMSK